MRWLERTGGGPDEEGGGGDRAGTGREFGSAKAGPLVEEWRRPMATWQIALLLLALVWGLQSLGVWMQMRHYGKVIREIRESEKDGFLGTGHVRGRFSKGTIAVVVASADGIVRKVSIMTGRSSLATFRERPELAGRPLTAFTTDAPGLPALTDGEQEAIRKAIGQIEQVRQKRGIEALTYDQANAQTA